MNNALLGGGGAASTSDVFNDYADSTDFNALFGDAILGNFDLNDETKSWKSKRSRGSSKVFDDFFGRSRNRSGSASGRRSRMISLSGFSGVSDMFDELFNNPADIDHQADQLMLTLNNMPSEGSIDRPLSPELLNMNPMIAPAMEFCDSCGFECRLINGVWKCNSSHCGKHKTQGSAPLASFGAALEETRMPKLEVKTECLSDNSHEMDHTSSALLPFKRTPKPKKNLDDEDSDEEEARRAAKAKKKKRVQVITFHSLGTFDSNFFKSFQIYSKIPVPSKNFYFVRSSRRTRLLPPPSSSPPPPAYSAAPTLRRPARTESATVPVQNTSEFPCDSPFPRQDRDTSTLIKWFQQSRKDTADLGHWPSTLCQLQRASQATDVRRKPAQVK